MPQMRYSVTQNDGLGLPWMTWLATTNTTRLPSTGPLVQKPIAVARPTWGEKSRISAGVATRQIPSTKPTMKPKTVNSHLLVEAGMMKATKTAVTPSPITTMLVRPNRSVSPAKRDPNAPIRLPKARVYTKKVKLICSFTRNRVDTEPPTYSS